MSIGILVRGKELSSKISYFNWCQRSWPSGIIPACHVGKRDLISEVYRLE